MSDQPTGVQRGDDGTLFETDRYLDDVAAGRVVEDDQLGELLSAAAFQAGCRMPAPPVLADYGVGAQAPATQSAMAQQHSAEPFDELASRRADAKPHRKEPSGWLYALAGAAASAAVVAGGLTVIQSAQPGDALWTAHEKIFGSEDEAQLVELASTLDQATELKKQGDMDGALRLLDHAQRIAATRTNRNTNGAVTTVHSVTKTVTETETQKEKPETVTVTKKKEKKSTTAAPKPTQPVVPAPAPAPAPVTSAPATPSSDIPASGAPGSAVPGGESAVPAGEDVSAEGAAPAPSVPKAVPAPAAPPENADNTARS